MANETPSLTGVVLNESTQFTLVELCELGKISAECVIEMVDEGVLLPEGESPRAWRFDSVALKRLQTAIHLQRDLRVNLPGAGLALDLLEELEELRQRLRR